MIHGSHHIVRGWKKEKRLLRIGLAAGLPAAFLVCVSLYISLPLGFILSALFLSLLRLFVAYAISAILAVAVAVLIGSSSRGEGWIAVFDVMQNVPSFALIPLFIAFFGYGNIMIITFAVTSIVWPILFAVVQALHTAKQSLNDAATIFGAVGLKRIFHYSLPLSYPAIVTGSIVGVAIGWEAVIGAEIIASLGGIGTFLNNATNSGETVLFFAGLSALLLVVFFINRLVWSPLLKRAYLYGE
jgi:ABC-type nitrate/sulfonate/bicarbonate transport system permease component